MSAPPAIRRHTLALPYRGLQLHGERWQVDGARGEALILHGGGSSSSAGFEGLRQSLAAAGLASTAFDFVGQGRSGGELADSSLADRVQQVLAVQDALGLDPASLSLLGFSMGAYVATRVAGLRAPAALGLAIPAAYAPAAYALPFGPQFSACIRQPRSWEHSQAFEILAGYRGRLLVLSAEADAVIPPEIPPRLYEAAAQASWRAHHRIPEAGHKLDAHYAQRPEDRQRAYARIVELCGGGSAG